mmetsp:Transcript_26307/g.39857  ORF Transcript_26307/g.39857 Transcript_26307/m.39857 type:complete len:88 (+) Transcript_26307:87-350(+)
MERMMIRHHCAPQSVQIPKLQKLGIALALPVVKSTARIVKRGARNVFQSAMYAMLVHVKTVVSSRNAELLVAAVIPLPVVTALTRYI